MKKAPSYEKDQEPVSRKIREVNGPGGFCLPCFFRDRDFDRFFDTYITIILHPHARKLIFRRNVLYVDSSKGMTFWYLVMICFLR